MAVGTVVVTMQSTVVHRLFGFAGLIVAVSVLTFMMANLLPGDPVLALLGENATPEAIEYWTKQFGLDQPVIVRYFDWLFSALQGDLGVSYQTREPVLSIILAHLPVTLQLVFLTTVVALVMAVPAAIYSAYRPNRAFDRISMTAAMGLLAMPPFLIGILLIMFFSVFLGWFPATGYTPITESVWKNLLSLTLPTLALALNEYPVYKRLLRADLMQTLQQDFVSVAKAKGLSVFRILVVHALRPSSLSLMTVVGVNLGRLLGGAIIIEVLFGLPGIGRLLINAIYEQDYLLIQGIVLFIAVGFVLINAIVDGTYRFLDPRAK